MFEFLKKKKTELPVDLAKEAEAEKAVTDSYNFQTMPKKFRVERQISGDARKKGIFIIIGGMIVLVGVSAAFYYFVVVNPKLFVKKTPVSIPFSEIAESNSSSASSTVAVPTEASSESLEAEAVVTEETVATSTTVSPKLLIDVDGDGLSMEEEIILGTKDDNLDSDMDGYSDNSELVNGYNPAGNGKIGVNSGLKLYSDLDYNFQTYYPSIWTVQKIGSGDVLLFDSGVNGYFQSAFVSNPEFLSLSAWYDKQFSPGANQKLEKMSIKNGDALYNREANIIYAMDKNRRFIVSLSYLPTESNLLIYQNLFLLFSANFEFLK